METSHKIMISLLIVITLLVTIIFGVVLTNENEIPTKETPIEKVESCPNICEAVCAGLPEPELPAECAIPMCDCDDTGTIWTDVQIEEEVEMRELDGGNILFSYPNDWHVSGYNFYDGPNSPKFGYNLSTDPIVTVSPTEGGPRWPVYISSFNTGDAIYAPYENGNYEDYQSDEITINGQKVKRLRLTGPRQNVYGPHYQEVLFFFGKDVGYEVIYQSFDNENKNYDEWLKIQNSIFVK